jgi:hypothetical protein
MVLLGAGSGMPAAGFADEDRMRDWQLSLLFAPSNQQVKVEKKGRVVIYDGMRSSDINRAMDEQFNRIENMMFVNTTISDQSGNPVKDPQTGLVMVEDDGCD